MVHPASTLFGSDTDTQFGTVFNQGLIKVEGFLGISDIQKDFFNKLQPTAAGPTLVDKENTTAHVKKGYKIWKEQTSTSPSGRHLGLYKVWLQKSDEKKNILLADQFFGLVKRVKNLVIKGKYTLLQWRIIHNLYLLKEAENFKIHRLPTLHIIESELSPMCREYMARQLMKNAELHQFILPDQYGGQKGKASIDIPALTVFNLDTLYFMRANMAFVYCDARACYDCIVVIMSVLAEQATGLALKLSRFFAATLNKLEYNMFTAYGPSQQTNINSEEHP
eukprot:10976972-Ditylum_brightwellii.AAC.1